MKLYFSTYNQKLKSVNILATPQIVDSIPLAQPTTRSINRYNMIAQIQNGGKCLACNKH